jgi:antitoxin component YwqK of YwqJK toxin-antitoxin module
MKKLFAILFITVALINSIAAQDVILKKDRYYNRHTGRPYTGQFKEYDPENQQLISETSIKDGYLDGSTTLYYSSGTVKEVRSYAVGKKHGTWTTFNESGVKTAEASFKEGKKDGYWYVWDDRGVKRYEMYYENGEKKGTWLIMDEDGKVTSREQF